MNEMIIQVVIGIILIGGLAVHVYITRRRHLKDHREDLEPILRAHGLRLVAARWPGMFKVGPFPKFEVEVGGPQSRVGGTRGEYNEYRVVTIKDSEGNIHELWARLEFELFQLRRVRWRVAAGHDVPAQASGLVENPNQSGRP